MKTERQEEVAHGVSGEEVRTPSFLRAKTLQVILRREKGRGRRGRMRNGRTVPGCRLLEVVAACDLSRQTPVIKTNLLFPSL